MIKSMKLSLKPMWVAARATVKSTSARRPYYFLGIAVATALLYPSAAKAQVTDPRTPEITWSELFPITRPSARAYMAMTYDPVSGKIVMFAGDDGNKHLNDTWLFDGLNWTRIKTDRSPRGRADTQMAYGAVSRKVVLFGGFDGASYLNDTWLWDGATLTWEKACPLHSPPAVTGPSLFTDPNGRVDKFGGANRGVYSGDMWQWNGSDWVQLHPTNAPTARSQAAVAVNEITKEVVLFGGLGHVNPDNTWTYDGTTWTLQSPMTQTRSVYAGSAMFDAYFQNVVLFGGDSGGTEQKTSWLRSGYSWNRLPVTQAPQPREGAGSAFHPVVGRAIMFGGANGGTDLNDTWQLLP